MNEHDRIRLAHMLDAAREAIAFTESHTLDSFRDDRKTVLAVVKDIEIIGEAAARLSHDIQVTHSEIPWPQIVGMRNRLIHAYFDIEVETVWKTVHEDLPALIVVLQRILGSTNTEDETE